MHSALGFVPRQASCHSGRNHEARRSLFFPAATFCPGWIAKREGIFAKYNLDVEMVLMQGPSTYMPALASGNIQVMYGGGTAISRAIGTGSFDRSCWRRRRATYP